MRDGNMALKNNDKISSLDPDNPANMHKYMALREIDDPKVARKTLLKEKKRAEKTIKEPTPPKKEPEKKPPKKPSKRKPSEEEEVEIPGPHLISFDTDMEIPEKVCVYKDRRGRIIIETDCAYEGMSPVIRG